MTYRHRPLLGFGLAAALASACSSSSSSAPAADTATDASPKGDDAGDAGGQGDGNQDDGGPPVADAGSPATCDAASLTPPADGGAAACFACQATHCAAEVAACATDCACGPAYACLERNGTGTLNSGYSACGEAVDALMNGNPALTGVAQCATLMCNGPCFGGDGG